MPHTPGPWTVGPRKAAVYDATHNLRVAAIDPGLCRDANAHLIAAAPTMYDTMKAAMEALQSGPPMDRVERVKGLLTAVIHEIDNKAP